MMDDDGDTILDDGLSVCDEDGQNGAQRHVRLTSAQYEARRLASKNYKCFALSLLTLTFLISVIVTAARYYRNPSGGGTRQGSSEVFGTNGNGNTAEENRRRLDRTLEYLVRYRVSDADDLTSRRSVAGALEMDYTPQYKAALWMAKYDRFRLPVPSSYETQRPSWGEEYPFLQRYALAVLFLATGGELHWTWKANFLRGYHECGWFDRFRIDGLGAGGFVFGVICDGEPDYVGDEGDSWGGRRTVTGVSLPPLNNMWGTLPPEVYHLRYLKVFHVQHNIFVTGTIPFQYGELKHLTTLALINNNLEGKIPRNLAFLKKLEILRLENNRFSGDSTDGDLDFLGEMTSLRKITLDYNPDLTGTLPDAVSKLSDTLVQLTLSNTNFYGTLPSSLARLTKLQKLFLDDCAFGGSVRDVLSRMTDLTHVYLEDNAFNDTVDDAFLAELKDLVHLDVSNCSFAGTVPGHFFDLPRLEVLDMSMNDLAGTLPADVMSNVSSSRLGFLSLHTNNITGPIPPGIGNLKNLTTLDLSSNRFLEKIPPEVGELDKLDILFLGRNDFDAGVVPEWIYNMSQLSELSLKGASLTGSIPKWLGDLTGLKLLDLGENELNDTIPQTLGQLSELMVLILNSNKLQGELGLGQLEKLETLLIDDNALTGTTEPMCVHVLNHFVADCGSDGVGAEVECECCTLCCADENVTCNDSEWLGNHGGIWETGYARIKWDFDDGFVSPLVNYNDLQ